LAYGKRHGHCTLPFHSFSPANQPGLTSIPSSIPVGSGCILECTGYIGRSILSHNVWNGDAFKLQIVAIVLGPTLVCAGLYLTLGYVVEALDRTLSRFPPRFYPIFFIPADVSCLVIQAIGGGIAAAAGYDNPGLLVHGNRTIM
jgi:hypothetical protein